MPSNCIGIFQAVGKPQCARDNARVSAWVQSSSLLPRTDAALPHVHAQTPTLGGGNLAVAAAQFVKKAHLSSYRHRRLSWSKAGAVIRRVDFFLGTSGSANLHRAESRLCCGTCAPSSMAMRSVVMSPRMFPVRPTSTRSRPRSEPLTVPRIHNLTRFHIRGNLPCGPIVTRPSTTWIEPCTSPSM